MPATKMQQSLRKKLIGEKWWLGAAVEQRNELCNDEYETVASLSNRLKKDNYDKELEVNNLSETSSNAAERVRREEEIRIFNEYKGIVMHAKPVVALEATDVGSDDEEDEREAARARKRKKSKKDVPVASAARRSSLSSVGSGDSGKNSGREGVRKQRSMGSRQSSMKSMKSLNEEG